MFECIKCKNEESIAEPRRCFEIAATDQSGSIIATIYGKIAEEHFGLPTAELIQETEHPTLEAAKRTGDQHYLIQLKHAKYTVRGEERQKFNISTIQCPLEDATTSPTNASTST